jgi:DNA-binding CsgD family transcriptional regulator
MEMFMKSLDEMFWDSTVEEIKNGYVFQEQTEEFICLICGQRFVKGVIYPYSDMYFDAEKFTSIHIREAHTSTFDYLLHLNKKWTGLTDLQKQLLEMFYSGKSDAEVVQELGGGSTSTVRNHRFTFREKQKQAKVFLALMELLDRQAYERDTAERHVPIHRTATAIDDRYSITEKETAEVLRKYFPDGPHGELLELPRKEKRKIIVLRQIMARFQADKRYSEKEVNEILRSALTDDYVTLRRYLIEYGFMDRKDDGSEYWVKAPQRPGRLAPSSESKGKDKPSKEKESENMSSESKISRRKELVMAYQENNKPSVGAFKLINKTNDRVLVGTSVNLDGTFNRIRFELQMGNHPNPSLQEDWNRLGEAQFEFEILETMSSKSIEGKDRRALLKLLVEVEKKWMEKLQPYGERGYH